VTRLLLLVTVVCLILAGVVVWGVHEVDAGRLLQEREQSRGHVSSSGASRSSSSYPVSWKRRTRRWKVQATSLGRTVRAQRVVIARLRSELRNARHVQAVVPSVSVPDIIRSVFGQYGEQAVRVAWCESRLQTSATNGQFRGLFQMGSWERATYGDYSDAWGQAQAAYRYFAATGFSWGPWECKP
jgi:hypothetical protein